MNIFSYYFSFMNDKSYKLNIPDEDKIYMTLCLKHDYKTDYTYLNKSECMQLQDLKNKRFIYQKDNIRNPHFIVKGNK